MANKIKLSALERLREQLFSYSDHTILQLTGFYGVHKPEDIGRTAFYYIQRRKNTGKIIVYFYSDLIRECQRVICANNNHIKNELLLSSGKMRNISQAIFNSQTCYAAALGIDKIIIKAYRNDDEEEKWIGYYVWGKYAYRMYPMFKEKFIKFIDQHRHLLGNFLANRNNSEITLYHLLSDKEGKQLWLNKGFSWWGYLNLRPASVSPFFRDCNLHLGNYVTLLPDYPNAPEIEARSRLIHEISVLARYKDNVEDLERDREDQEIIEQYQSLNDKERIEYDNYLKNKFFSRPSFQLSYRQCLSGY